MVSNRCFLEILSPAQTCWVLCTSRRVPPSLSTGRRWEKKKERVGGPQGRTGHGREEGSLFQEIEKTLSEEGNQEGGEREVMGKGRVSGNVVLQSRAGELVSTANFFALLFHWLSVVESEKGLKNQQKQGWDWGPSSRTGRRFKSRDLEVALGCLPVPTAPPSGMGPDSLFSCSWSCHHRPSLCPFLHLPCALCPLSSARLAQASSNIYPETWPQQDFLA